MRLSPKKDKDEAARAVAPAWDVTMRSREENAEGRGRVVIGRGSRRTLRRPNVGGRRSFDSATLDLPGGPASYGVGPTSRARLSRFPTLHGSRRHAHRARERKPQAGHCFHPRVADTSFVRAHFDIVSTGGVLTGGTYSKAPISHRAGTTLSPSAGRTTPRWSLELQVSLLPRSIAGLPGWSA